MDCAEPRKGTGTGHQSAQGRECWVAGKQLELAGRSGIHAAHLGRPQLRGQEPFLQAVVGVLRQHVHLPQEALELAGAALRHHCCCLRRSLIDSLLTPDWGFAFV